jgi:predicted glycoside hydrolase/deacetylase ChbG (UPF0249 family)
VLQNLGFASDDRVVIIHTDDIGMCQASVSAFADLWDFGVITSGAVMVPCPWFMAAAEMCTNHPEMDMGVHLTLTSEWKHYRWGPVSTRDPKSGLLDEQGYFYHLTAEAQQHGDPECVALELQAQVQRALAAGMRPTHLDTHMGSVAHPKFMGAYLQVALQHGLPPMIFRMDRAGWEHMGFDAETAGLAEKLTHDLEEQGVPLLDHILQIHTTVIENRLDYVHQSLANLKPGLTHLIIHPSKDTPELRAITPDWQGRVADYEIFSSESMRATIADLGLQLIGYRDVQRLMPIG